MADARNDAMLLGGTTMSSYSQSWSVAAWFVLLETLDPISTILLAHTLGLCDDDDDDDDDDDAAETDAAIERKNT